MQEDRSSARERTPISSRPATETGGHTKHSATDALSEERGAYCGVETEVVVFGDRREVMNVTPVVVEDAETGASKLI